MPHSLPISASILVGCMLLGRSATGQAVSSKPTEEQLRQHRTALAELESLGAKITKSVPASDVIQSDSIRSIEFGVAFVGNEDDLRRLKSLVEVPQIIFSSAKTADGWIRQAAGIERLEELHVYQAQVSDAVLTPLANHPRLKQVGVYYTAVGNEVLAPLAKIPELSFVKLYGTRVTAEGVDNFRLALGKVKVDFRRGAFLGVGCVTLDNRCTISAILSDGPADKAGLLREDVVDRFGNAKVVDFNHLTDLVSQRDAGDMVELQVIRRDKDGAKNTERLVTSMVTLARWDVDVAVHSVGSRQR
jgi:hypothetical protein